MDTLNVGLLLIQKRIFKVFCILIIIVLLKNVSACYVSIVVHIYWKPNI